MKNFLRFGFVLLFLVWGFDGVGQSSTPKQCGTPSPTIKQGDKIMKSVDSFEQLKLSQNLVTQYIPIQFHNIIPVGGGGGLISTSYINDILDKLNFWYSGVGIYFYSNGSVNTISNTSLYNFNYSSFVGLVNDYGYTNAINVFFVGSIDGSTSTTGVARFPLDIAETESYSLKNSNAIVIGKGFSETYQAEKTIPHEIGHYFGLYHTHETIFGSELVNGSNNATTGDRITDTPADPNRPGCVILCIYSTFCSSRDANNQKYSPQINNIMSYYDDCGGLITSGQYNRVQWGKYVRNILNPNLSQRYYLDGVSRTILRYAGSTLVCAGNTINLTLNSYGDPSYCQGNFYVQIKPINDYIYSAYISSAVYTSTGEVTITGTIPSNTPAGYYKVRIAKGSSTTSESGIVEQTIYINGTTNGTPTGSPIASQYALATTTLYNATSTCAGRSIALDANISGYDVYWWTRNGVNYTASSTNSALNATETGSYTLNMMKCGNVYRSSNSINLNFYEPTPSLTASSNGASTNFRLATCEGSLVTLSAGCQSGMNTLWNDGSTSSIRYINASSTRDFFVNCNNSFCNVGYSPPVRITALNPNVQSIKTGDWQDVTLWTSNLVPLNCQTVTIQTGHTVNVPINDAKAKNIIIKGRLNFINVSPTVKGKVGLGI